MQKRFPLVALLFAGTLAAQSTWIVDASGGSNFTDLPAAVAAAQPGDLVLVRAGGYSPATITRGIRIVGEAGAYITSFTSPALVLSRVPAGETCVVRGLQPGALFAPSDLQVLDCQGQVHIEDLQLSRGIDVQRSAEVSLCELRGQSMPPPLRATDSRVLIAHCSLTAHLTLGAPLPGLRIERSTVVVVHSRLAGSMNYAGAGAGAGIELVSGSLTLAGDTTQIATGLNLQAGPPMPAILATGGSLVIDPQVQLVPMASAPAILGSAMVTTQQVPVADASVAAGVLTARTQAAAGDLVVLLVGPALQPVVSAPWGDAWLGANSLAFPWAIAPANGVTTWTLPLPVLPPALLGTFQAIVVRNGNLMLSTPMVTTLDG